MLPYFVILALFLIGIVLFMIFVNTTPNTKTKTSTSTKETFEAIISGNVNTLYNEDLTNLPALNNLKLYLSAFSANSFMDALTSPIWTDISGHSDKLAIRSSTSTNTVSNFEKLGQLIARNFIFASPPSFTPLQGFLMNENHLLGCDSFNLEPNENSDMTLSWYSTTLNSSNSSVITLFKSYGNTYTNNGLEVILLPAALGQTGTAASGTNGTNIVQLVVNYGPALMGNATWYDQAPQNTSVWSLPIAVFQSSTPILCSVVKRGLTLSLYISGNSMSPYKIAGSDLESNIFWYSNRQIEINPTKNWACYLAALVYHNTPLTQDQIISLKNHLDREQSGQTIKDKEIAATTAAAVAAVAASQENVATLTSQLNEVTESCSNISPGDINHLKIQLRTEALKNESTRYSKSITEGSHLVNAGLQNGLEDQTDSDADPYTCKLSSETVNNTTTNSNTNTGLLDFANINSGTSTATSTASSNTGIYDPYANINSSTPITGSTGVTDPYI